jgi:hypothetical protein
MKWVLTGERNVDWGGGGLVDDHPVIRSYAHLLLLDE